MEEFIEFQNSSKFYHGTTQTLVKYTDDISVMCDIFLGPVLLETRFRWLYFSQIQRI